MPRLFSAFLRKFFFLLYNQFAFTYDLVAWVVSFGNWKKWVSAIKDSISPGRVLELGFGPGYLITDLLSENQDIYGIDMSPFMARLARRKILSANKDLRIAIADGAITPFPDQSFDQIIATFPAEYFFAPQTLGEFHRILKPGGSIGILPLVVITGPRPHHRLLAWIYRLTGQSTDDPNVLIEVAKRKYSQQGFDLQPQFISGSFYKLLILQAAKRN